VVGQRVSFASNADTTDGYLALPEAGRGPGVIVFEYPGRRHAFFNDERPEGYDAGHSADAWERTLGLLDARLLE